MSSKLRVGVLAPPWIIPPPDYGGLENALDCMCRGLQNMGVGVYLWSHRSSTCPVERSGSILDWDYSAGWHPAPDEATHVIEGYAWLQRNSVDIIHDHTWIGPLVSPQISRAPVVATNFLPFTAPAGVDSGRPDLSAIYPQIAKFVPVIAISGSQAAEAPFPVAAIIPHGVDVVGVEPGDGKGDENGPYFAVVGRMSAIKGIDLAIELATRCGVRLKIAARAEEASEKEYYDHEIRPRLVDRQIEYVGVLNREERDDFVGRAKALVNLVRWQEPLGLVMIEALAVGTPVIASDSGATSEVVQDGVTGYVCADLDQAVSAVENINGLSRATCRTDVIMRFSSETCARAHVAFYNRVIRGELENEG